MEIEMQKRRGKFSKSCAEEKEKCRKNAANNSKKKNATTTTTTTNDNNNNKQQRQQQQQQHQQANMGSQQAFFGCQRRKHPVGTFSKHHVTVTQPLKVTHTRGIHILIGQN